MNNKELNEIINEIDVKIEKLEQEEKNGTEADEIIKSDQTEEAMETLKEVVAEINAIEDLKVFKNNDEQSYKNMILTVVSWFEYLKREKSESPEYEEAKKLVMSIGEKHTILYDWCKNIVEKTPEYDPFINRTDVKLNAEESDEENEERKLMDIEEIKNKLKRKTTIFNTGGIRPTNELYESWIGKVGWQQENETQPIDEKGNFMIPLATLFLENLEYVPEALKGIKLITIFMSNDIWNNLSSFDYKNWFIIKTYENLDNIVPCNYTSENIIPFPLVPKLMTNDFPLFEDLEDEMLDIINELEENENIDYYDDILEENYAKHKIGGYPSYIQSGVGYDTGFEFVLQITSDSKAKFNIVDSGNFYFGYNPTTKEWSIRCDFY